MDIVSLLGAGDPARPNLAVVVSTLRAGHMTPLHRHAGAEAVEVVEGAVTVYRGGEVVRLSAGETLLLAANEPHAVRADAAAAGIRSACFVASVARYEDFLRAASVPGGALCEQDAATIDAIAAVNGIRVLGAPGELPPAAAEAAA